LRKCIGGSESEGVRGQRPEDSLQILGFNNGFLNRPRNRNREKYNDVEDEDEDEYEDEDDSDNELKPCCATRNPRRATRLKTQNF
jgi:hypothetical protein